MMFGATVGLFFQITKELYNWKPHTVVEDALFGNYTGGVHIFPMSTTSQTASNMALTLIGLIDILWCIYFD